LPLRQRDQIESSELVVLAPPAPVRQRLPHLLVAIPRHRRLRRCWGILLRVHARAQSRTTTTIAEVPATTRNMIHLLPQSPALPADVNGLSGTIEDNKSKRPAERLTGSYLRRNRSPELNLAPVAINPIGNIAPREGVCAESGFS